MERDGMTEEERTGGYRLGQLIGTKWMYRLIYSKSGDGWQ